MGCCAEYSLLKNNRDFYGVKEQDHMVLNEEISKFLEEHYGNLFEIYGCYENVFKIITGDVPELSQKDMKALFCYAYNGIYYYRHDLLYVRG